MKSLEEKRRMVINYIKRNPLATTKEIRRNVKVKVEEVFSGGIKEAYLLAGVGLPKHLQKRSGDECKQLVVEYIKKNPDATITEIQNKLGVNVRRLFGGIREAYRAANVPYPFERDRNSQAYHYFIEEKKKKIIEIVKNNPLITQDEINKLFNTNVAKVFGSFKNLCRIAGVRYLRYKKRRLKKQLEVINYIKNHPNATQREINKYCKTHVQEIFDGGIREAYKLAGVDYPEIRRKIYGTVKKEIRERSIEFEKEVFSILEKFGTVKKHVRTKCGIVDAVLITKEDSFVIEIKDYQSKPISNTEIKQIEKYLNSLNLFKGIIVCSTKNYNKNKINLGGHKIWIVTKDELANGAVR